MAETSEHDAGQVDDAPISPIERKNSLENHLQHRPERSELIESKSTPILRTLAHGDN